MSNPLLERYLAGAHREVWEDLLELGAAVRTEFYYNHAKAVADETMRRARHNVESLVEKLTKLGFHFGVPAPSLPFSDPFNVESMEQSMEQSVKTMFQHTPLRLPGSQDPSQIAKDMIERMKKFGDPGFQPRDRAEDMLQQMSRQVAEMREQIAKRGIDLQKMAASMPKPKVPPAFEPAPKNAKKPLDTFEKSAGGPLPIALRSWYELVGGVNLEGTHAALAPPGQHDSRGALTVLSFADAKKFTQVMCEDEEESEGPDSSELILWGQDGDQFSIQVPDASADGALIGWRGMTFVGHLRRAFAWGGFPGWEHTEARPQKEIDYLREGLLPL